MERPATLRLVLVSLYCALMQGCNSNQEHLYGYVEANLTYLSSPFAGKLDKLDVARGSSVNVGDTLFSLEALPESADATMAQAQLNAAQATLANLQKGKRPSELAALDAQIQGAQASIAFLEKELKRRQKLVKRSAIEQAALDDTVAKLDESIAQLNYFKQNLITAKLPARSDEIKAAEFQIKSAQALLQKTNWALAEKSVTAPAHAEVFDTYFQVGERVPANRPVLSLLVPKDVKVVFFVPEPMLSQIKLNQEISVSCDGCQKNIKSTVVFIAPKAEFTPPIIYSQSARSKLVYRVEGSITEQDIDKIRPGQPVDISLNWKPH